MVSKEGGTGMEDPAGFFANVFGGERFMEYVCVFFSPLSVPLLLKTNTDRRDLADERHDECRKYNVIRRGKSSRSRNFQYYDRAAPFPTNCRTSVIVI